MTQLHIQLLYSEIARSTNNCKCKRQCARRNNIVTDSIVLKDRTTRYTEEELANGINVDLSAHEVAELSFRVTVNDLENRAQISNTATVNDVPTETITHRYIEPIISATKESTTANDLDYVVEGEIITYTITVQNSGDLEEKLQ